MTKAIYCMGDFHGRHDLLVVLRKMIRQDRDKHGYDEAKIVYLGDYVDRGPDSYKVVDALMNQPMVAFEEVFLKGNHEEITYKSVDHSTRSTGGKSSFNNWRDMWLMNGGVATLKSYGCSPVTGGWDFDSLANLKDQSRWDWADIADKFRDHALWMKSLQSFHVDGNLFFVHAGVRPTTSLFKQKQEDMLWIRQEFLQFTWPIVDHDQEYRVVHGHTPTRSGMIEYYDNRIACDVGAVWQGRHCAIVFEDGVSQREIWTPKFDVKLENGR